MIRGESDDPYLGILSQRRDWPGQLASGVASYRQRRVLSV
jgi:hypothetical protein